MPSFRICLLVWLLVAASTVTGAAEFRPTALHIYYGGNARVLASLRERLAAGHVAVIETRAVSDKELTRLREQAARVGAIVLGYVSIGELHGTFAKEFARFHEEFQRKGRGKAARFPTLRHIEIESNAQFGSQRMDVLADAWREYVLGEVDRVYALRLDGLFLDTVDTVDVYLGRKSWEIPRRAESVRAMVSLVRAIKAKQPRKFVLQNRGLNLIGEQVYTGAAEVKVAGLALAKGHEQNPDGVLWEDAFSAQDEWSRAKERELKEIHKSKKAAVFTLGYRETVREPGPFFQKASAAGFIPAWATSSLRLAEEATVSQPK